MKRILLMVLFGGVFIACKKETKCETWEVTDYCVAKDILVSCAPPSYLTINVCGDDLKHVKEGKEIIRKEDSGVILYRKYIRRAS